MVYVKAPTRASAFRLFSILNTRGLQLSTADLLKSENVGAIDSADQERYAKEWEDVEESLGRSALEELIAHIGTIHIKDKYRQSIREFAQRLRLDAQVALHCHQLPDLVEHTVAPELPLFEPDQVGSG
jgi:hypothetical protein